MSVEFNTRFISDSGLLNNPNVSSSWWLGTIGIVEKGALDQEVGKWIWIGNAQQKAWRRAFQISVDSVRQCLEQPTP